MKEASGELSMTAVAVVAIAAIGVVFTTLIWPQIKSTIVSQTHCSSAFDCGQSVNGRAQCKYCTNDDCSQTATVYCKK